jgi:hypothetical protein
MTALEVPPPVTPFEGVVTVIVTAPWTAASVAAISAVICSGLWKDVARGAPLKFTKELVTKFEPLTVKLNGFPEAGMFEGLIDEIIGEKADTGNSTDVEAPPPGSGLKTKTTAVPSLSISLARIFAFNCVELTNIVTRACPPKYTVAPGTKFDPMTCRVKAVSLAVVDGGESEEIMGTGFSGVDGP